MRFIKGKTGKSIIIILVFLILFNVCVPNYSYADEGNDTSLAGLAGKLIEPVSDLVASIADAVMNFMQEKMMPGSPKAVDVHPAMADMLVETGITKEDAEKFLKGYNSFDSDNNFGTKAWNWQWSSGWNLGWESIGFAIGTIASRTEMCLLVQVPQVPQVV